MRYEHKKIKVKKPSCLLRKKRCGKTCKHVRALYFRANKLTSDYPSGELSRKKTDRKDEKRRGKIPFTTQARIHTPFNRDRKEDKIMDIICSKCGKKIPLSQACVCDKCGEIVCAKCAEKSFYYCSGCSGNYKGLN